MRRYFRRVGTSAVVAASIVAVHYGSKAIEVLDLAGFLLDIRQNVFVRTSLSILTSTPVAVILVFSVTVLAFVNIRLWRRLAKLKRRKRGQVTGVSAVSTRTMIEEREEIHKTRVVRTIVAETTLNKPD